MDINKNTKWLRKAAYAPLAVAVLAGALSSGAGISTADATTTPTGTDTLQSGDTYNWALLNRTGQPIYGTWDWSMEWSEDGARVVVPADNPLRPDDAVMGAQTKNPARRTTWTGRICYDEHWWNYKYTGYTGNEPSLVFRLEADSTHVLYAYHTLKLFDDYRIALTPENGVCRS
ncbi:hypothetical protein R3Q06_35725 [Rhodococcus erythropolis]|uniref:hypothetical protein n=1 Tax=Rhodococcus erythropolis TaxID=1833 RepID=UPI00294A8C23|nr:hypothetical protein [Rhodococcus erythropolis]MDV6278721.1 hypothetical protein [Rhodococcus erythropolis]